MTHPPATPLQHLAIAARRYRSYGRYRSRRRRAVADPRRAPARPHGGLAHVA